MRLSPARRAAIERISTALLIIASAIMILIGKTDQALFQSLRISIMDAAAPALELMSRPAAALDVAAERVHSFLSIYRDNLRLAEENQKLLALEQVALRLSAENAQLRELSKLAPEPGTSFLTARVISETGGSYARSVIVNAGRDNGVARGQAAMTADGLVGRIVEVGGRAARILLITDLNSRVPVVVDGSRQRAILAGDNSARPSLRYLDAGGAVRIGDRIVTSGQGGVFPPGLPVGIVAGDDGEAARIDLYAALPSLDYLRIVDYGLGDALPNSLSVSARGGKRTDASGSGLPPIRH